MNLYDMAQRKDRNLVLGSTAAVAKLDMGGATWRGIGLQSDAAPQVRLRRAPMWYPLTERRPHVGWMACGGTRVRRWFGLTRGRLDVWFEHAGERLTSTTLRLGRELQPVRLPWPKGELPDDAELVFHVPPGCGTVFLAAHRALDRAPLLRSAYGRGVEIGPGPNPQIRPAPGVDVIYLEQMSAEAWAELYNGKGKYALDPTLWEHYRQGEAHALPVDDESLDFVFSSHVFEHLANPVGHLRHWHRKLRKGGSVLAVVPDVAGAKDYMFRPCALRDLLAEEAAETFLPVLAHYERWTRRKGGSAAELLAKRWSIHVHFYTRENTEQLLQHAVDHIGFESFELRHHENHKDFHFVLRK